MVSAQETKSGEIKIGYEDRKFTIIFSKIKMLAAKK